ncbi:MAG: ISKra4 family transposase, partial [Acidobacteriota bacterium]
MGAMPCPRLVEPFAAAAQQFERITLFLRSGEACSLTHSDLERTLEAQGRELLRQLLQGHLDLRRPGAATGPVSDADGGVRSRAQIQTRGLESIFGTVTVGRTGYGTEGAASLHPLDGALNLPREKYSHEVRRRVAVESAKSSFDEGVKSLEAYTGAHVPKRQFEQLVVRAAEDFDTFYEIRHDCAQADPNTGPILVLTVDGKGVVMRPEDLREATQRAASTRADTFTARLGRGRRLHAKRMACVAAVYTIDPFVRTPEDILPPVGTTAERKPRPRPEHKRVWASLEQTPDEVITAMFDEADHRDPHRQKTWVALVDGNTTQIRILRTLARKRHIPLQIVVDFIHVAEYVWKAGLAFHPADSEALDAWVRVRLLEILRGHASHVAAGMRRSATLRSLPAADRKPVDAGAGYLLTYAPYLRYQTALSTGLPIASGIIEGACRHLVNDRMDLTGARWSLPGAEAVLQLRALRSSDDFDDYWV